MDEVKKRGRPSKNKRGTFTFRVTADLRDQIERRASETGKSCSEVIEAAIAAGFAHDVWQENKRLRALMEAYNVPQS